MQAGKRYRDLVFLGGVFFLALGLCLVLLKPGPLLDFRLAYTSARCLVLHCDPYSPSEILRVYRAQGETQPADTDRAIDVLTLNIYPPSEFAFTLPFALLPPNLAQVLWIALIAGGMLIASFLIWDESSIHAPAMAGIFIFYLLVCSGSMLSYANPGCIAAGLCVIATWCLVRERFHVWGIVCLTASLLLKPHDAGLIWLYFLLAGGKQRKYALQTLIFTVLLCLPILLWVGHLSPSWMQELRANLTAAMVPGGINDPGPGAAGGHGSCVMTSLQAAIALLWDDPRIYNPASYAISAPFLILWGFITLKRHFTPARAWFGLAAVSALTLLPVYHRQYDGKIVMLALPACAILWAEGRTLRWMALAITAAGFTVVGDLPWTMLIALLNRLHMIVNGVPSKVGIVLLNLPAPLILLLMTGFYLWVYAQRTDEAAT